MISIVEAVPVFPKSAISGRTWSQRAGGVGSATGAPGGRSGSPRPPAGAAAAVTPSPGDGVRDLPADPRPATSTPFPQPRSFPATPGSSPAPERKAGARGAEGTEATRVCEGVSADNRNPAGTTPPLPELPPRTSRRPGAPRLPAPGQSGRAASPPARGASSSALPGLRAATPSVPKGLGAARETEGVPCPAPPPPLTCSALCGSSGARRPGRRRTGFRHRRCPRPAGSRWWSPHGSAGPAAAAGAAAARGGSSRRRRRRGGDQNAAGRIARRLRARERAEDPAGRPRPGEAVLPANQRGGGGPRGYGRRRPARGSLLSSPRARTLAPPPPPAPALPQLRPPSRGTPREVAVEGVARGRQAAGQLRRPPRRERMGLRPRLLSRCPGRLRASGDSGAGAASARSPARSESCRLCLSE
uniref:Uncharacterized protein n=2 Tax=Rangifer tarandus platyrhynchus TaxID=3082113 RepID=A0ACB0EP61_RANTA|nr:unnamed protein product [Rangifer tarandus platyrhynchus]